MYNTALHAEFLRDHADYGFDAPLLKFNWRFEIIRFVIIVNIKNL